MKNTNGTNFGFYDMSEDQKQKYYEAWMYNLPDPEASTVEDVYDFFTNSDLWNDDDEELFTDFTDEDFRALAKWVINEIEFRAWQAWMDKDKFGDEE